MMKALNHISVLLTLSVLSACASSGEVDLKVHEITSLADPEPNTGSFRGLEFLADPIYGQVKNRVNIFYLHGIGWTEKPDEEQLANNFLSGIAKAYGREVEGQIITTSCGQGSADAKPYSGPDANHIFINAQSPTQFETALPGTYLELDRLICMDRQVLKIGEYLEFVIYRIFWDEIFWRGLQYPHVGQDDDQGASSVFARLRRKYNRRLKDELVNYGFSDAVMYLGPAGAEIRNAIRGAMCSAALDAAGYDFSQQGATVRYGDSCRLASQTSIKTNQFAFVTESLGSKITFDLMREAMTDNRDTIIDEMIAGSEFYMLANQVALLSLSDLAPVVSNTTRSNAIYAPSSDKTRPKIIAMSELNDFLTYELVPFFRQLWKRARGGKPESPPSPTTGTPDKSDFDDPTVRAAIIRRLGFDMIDMRIEFADKLVPVLNGLVDPLQAHSGHADQPELMLYMLCGAQSGVLRSENCLATDSYALQYKP